MHFTVFCKVLNPLGYNTMYDVANYVSMHYSITDVVCFFSFLRTR